MTVTGENNSASSYNPDNYLTDRDLDAIKHAEIASKIESLLKNLSETKVRLGVSNTHGVGVFAVADIIKGSQIFKFNGNPKFGATLDLLPEHIDKLPPHVQEMVNCFFLKNEDGSYTVPEVGLVGALGIDKYLNSSMGQQDDESSVTAASLNLGNVLFGDKLDESGYLEVVATEDIQAGEELLVDYQIHDCRRKSNRHNESTTCGACSSNVVRGDDDVIDTECQCTQLRLWHKKCASKWYTKIAELKFKPTNQNTGSPRQIWAPSIYLECRICKKKLSENFTTFITKKLANGRKGIMRDMANQILLCDDVHVRLNTKVVQPKSGGSKKGKNQESGKRKHQNSIDNKLSGFLSNRRAQFYLEEDRVWINGFIHEYISANKRKRKICSCKGARRKCSCPNLRRGAYRYTFKNEFDELVEDYFSDEDDTVRVNGLSGSDLWG